ncbi:minor tail protein [Gordonia phage Finkle]|uniref:Minor tail protein n=1 Tax=Gordonia phage Finkle TaxID=2926099 RepID=A0A9E7NHJ4_9CAUD|nr:minor tail protein [Gordonia phage Finkle]UTN92938.1 minor tail protein [Gordonia phage Finkle]
MTVILGSRRPTEPDTALFNIEIGLDNGLTQWRPFGEYQRCKWQWCWGIPAVAEIQIAKTHPMAPVVMACRRRIVSVVTEHNGIPWNGRVMGSRYKGRPGQEVVTAYLVNNLIWQSSALAWPQPLFPRPEFQFPKHDIGFGSLDGVYKYFSARNYTRLLAPVYAKLPIRYDTPALPDLNQIQSIDDLLDYMADSTDDLVAAWARMTPLDELHKAHFANSKRAPVINLYRPGIDPDPGKVFNADSLGHLENIISWEGLEHFFYFLNPGNILGLANPNNWLKATQPCYVLDTVERRDRRHMEWRTDGGNIIDIERYVTHPEGYQVVVGGKAPEIANNLVQMAINLLIQGAMSALQIGGAAPVVGDLFNDIFFAYNMFSDPDLKAELGRHALPEKFANSGTAFSLDSLSAGSARLKEIGGQDTVKLTVLAGAGGYEFGADDGSGKRFQVGDTMTLTDTDFGTSVEQWVSAVEIEHTPGEQKVTTVTLGDDLQLRSGWERVVDKIGMLAGGVNAIANSTS